MSTYFLIGVLVFLVLCCSDRFVSLLCHLLTIRSSRLQRQEMAVEFACRAAGIHASTIHQNVIYFVPSEFDLQQSDFIDHYFGPGASRRMKNPTLTDIRAFLARNNGRHAHQKESEAMNVLRRYAARPQIEPTVERLVQGKRDNPAEQILPDLPTTQPISLLVFVTLMDQEVELAKAEGKRKCLKEIADAAQPAKRQARDRRAM